MALLRAVNVGGRNRVPMAELRALASELGYVDVSTHLASGNLRFSSDKDEHALQVELGEALASRFGFPIDVLVLDAATLRRASEQHPFADGDPKRVHVGFLSSEITDAQLATLHNVATASERLDAAGRLVWLDFADGVHASKLAAKLNTAFRPGFCTARSLSTVRALASAT